MQTLLSRFCEEFVSILQPLLSPLGKTADLLTDAPANAPGINIKTPLIELRRQMQQLSEKVTDQQAYVLIFGPLKSGKSTLMNGIAGSYVSEVSSLPAYPCMVFVSHADERSFKATRYSGKTEEFTEVEQLNLTVERAHRDLATKIRESEKQGANFDPGVDFENAISRIDVRVPTNELGASRAVLVDTPGLYSRMKFGYDRMTRDFRNTAACAIFVVRSDNLFLEQVFAEFTDLLDLFSRIFLVVNIDSTKRDLGPDGELVPSLEQRDPARVIEAFEKLAMSAPLREAADAGRLSIYPIDLLHAASDRMSEKEAGKDANDRNKKDFDRFFADLTDYLDSSDYIVSFLGDSMRRGATLLGDTEELCKHEEIEALRRRIAELERQHGEQEARRQALERLESAGWTKKFDRLGGRLSTACHGLATDINEKTSRTVIDTVKGWFKTNQSLQHLTKTDLNQIFTQHQEELTSAVSKELSERLVTDGVGIELSEQARKALEIIEIDLAAMSRAAHGMTDRRALIAVPPTPLRTDHFRIRRGLLDWILFRRQTTLRRRLFGPPGNPALSIRADAKRARLGDAGLEEMRKRMEDYKRGFFTETEQRVVAGFARGYCKIVLDGLTSSLRSRRTDVEQQLGRINDALTGSRRLLGPLDDLAKRTTVAMASLDKLTKHYRKADLFALTKPVESEHDVTAAAPKEGAAPAAPPVTMPRPRGAAAQPTPEAKPAAKPRPRDPKQPSRLTQDHTTQVSTPTTNGSKHPPEAPPSR